MAGGGVTCTSSILNIKVIQCQRIPQHSVHDNVRKMGTLFVGSGYGGGVTCTSSILNIKVIQCQRIPQHSVHDNVRKTGTLFVGSGYGRGSHAFHQS